MRKERMRMSIHIKDMKDLKMYNRNNKLFIPLNPDDNTHGSLIYLLTSDISSSIDMINNNMVINNKKWFKSYYIDKSNLVIKPISKEFIYDGQEHKLNSEEYEIVSKCTRKTL